MKQGKSLTQLAQEIERQSESKNDFLCESQQINMQSNDDKVILTFDDQRLSVNQNAHSQIATWSGIGTRYYNKMLFDSPELLSNNVNHWLQHEANHDKKRMVRELDGKARAFLSDRYLRLDNDVTMQTALTALSNVDDVKINSCEVTDDKLYIKAVFPKTETEVKLNDPVQCGVVITNSEVGRGSFEIKALVYRLVCLNGMITSKTADSLKRRHLGSRITQDNIVYSSETIELMTQATLSECADAIRTFSSRDYFQSLVDKMKAASANVINNVDPEKTVKKLSKAFSFNDTERKEILERFIRDQDYSQYGALNAVTNLANDTESYDRASDLEIAGGKILDLNQNQWERIAVTM